MQLPTLFDIEYGEPWRLHDKAGGIGVPILRISPEDRNYKMHEEVKDQIEIVDTGNINRARVKNKTNYNVFFRRGTMLVGKTQSRALTTSVVVAPHKELTPEIRCVYASKGIRGGSKFDAVGYVPRTVMSSLHQNQGAVWSAVSTSTLQNRAHYSLIANAGNADAQIMMGSLKSTPHDDLAGTMRAIDQFKDKIEKYLKNIPIDHIRQIGIMIVDMSGVVGLEMFDSPESWRALSASVVRDYSDVLGKELPELYEIKMERVKEYAVAFIQNLLKTDGGRVFDGENAETYLIETDEIVGEFTLLDDGVIHLLAMKVEKSTSKNFNYFDAVAQPAVWTTTGTHPTTTWTTTPLYITRAEETYGNYTGSVRGKGVMRHLAAQPSTFGNIQSNTGMSSKTVSRALKDGQDLGLIERAPSDGSMIYSLTAAGQYIHSKSPRKS